MSHLPRFSVFDVWFRPKGFESERFYERLGARVIKRYVPTGGDVVIRRLRRHHLQRRWVTSSLQSLCTYERRTRLNESIHLIGFVGFTGLAVSKFAAGPLTAVWLTVALALNLILGLWPAVLQRYNRLRLYRAIARARRPAKRVSVGPSVERRAHLECMGASMKQVRGLFPAESADKVASEILR